MKRKLSNNGLALIKQFEGCRLLAYKCQCSEQYYTIGYGHYGADVIQGMTITQEQADNLLLKDIDKFVNHVNTYMDKYNFNQNQFDSLVSFAFNIGSIKQLTNNGTRSISEISSKIPEYCNAGGKKLAGLVTRRNKEKELFDTPVSDKSITEIAKEVIAGKWGNGDERKVNLANAGYDYNTVQNKVNNILNETLSALVNRIDLETVQNKKSVKEIAKEVIAGKWGNGDERKSKLANAGYDYNTVQTEVNRLLK